MPDTMEMEGVVEEGGVELSADEESHIRFLRDKNISAKEVTGKIDAHLNRPASAQPAAVPQPQPQAVSAPEVRKMFAEYDQKAKQSARASEAQRQIKAAIGKQVDDSGLTRRPKRRDRIVEEVFESLCDREDVKKLGDEDFQKVLVDESNKAIDEEREDGGGTPPQSSTTPSQDEGRKTAAATMGQTDGKEPPPKSAVQTERSDPGRTFDVKDPRFGLDIEFPTDQAIQRDSSREAREFLRDRGKRQ